MNCKRRLEEYLRENTVPFQTQHHPRAVTAQEVAATEHVPGRMFAKTVVVSTDGGEMWMLALPAPYHVNTEKPPQPLASRRRAWPAKSASLRPSPTARSGRCRRSGTSTASPFT